MKFADIASVYLNPAIASPAVRPVSRTPARRLRDALEPIATQGWWAKEVHDRLEPHGLGFLDGYVWGRAAALGEPVAGVVAAAFGVFEPVFLAAVLAQGRAAISRADVLAVREAGAVASLARLVPETDELGAAADALLDATHGLDATMRPLFAGLREVSLPASVHGRLWRAAELVREHRGDGHLAACIAEGLGPVEMSVLTELWLGYPAGEYSSTRGYGPDAIAAAAASLGSRGWVSDGTVTAAGQAARDAIEAATDRSQQSLVDALGRVSDSALDRIAAVAERASAAILAGGAFPNDARKRAAG